MALWAKRGDVTDSFVKSALPSDGWAKEAAKSDITSALWDAGLTIWDGSLTLWDIVLDFQIQEVGSQVWESEEVGGAGWLQQ